MSDVPLTFDNDIWQTPHSSDLDAHEAKVRTLPSLGGLASSVSFIGPILAFVSRGEADFQNSDFPCRLAHETVASNIDLGS
jgi:hypothetical protein